MIPDIRTFGLHHVDQVLHNPSPPNNLKAIKVNILEELMDLNIAIPLDLHNQGLYFPNSYKDKKLSYQDKEITFNINQGPNNLQNKMLPSTIPPSRTHQHLRYQPLLPVATATQLRWGKLDMELHKPIQPSLTSRTLKKDLKQHSTNDWRS